MRTNTSNYYCRGCGRELPARFRGLFHKDCLRLDKQHRVRKARRREQEKLKALLRKIACPNCGVRYGTSKCDPPRQRSCEASHEPENTWFGVDRG